MFLLLCALGSVIVDDTLFRLLRGYAVFLPLGLVGSLCTLLLTDIVSVGRATLEADCKVKKDWRG